MLLATSTALVTDGRSLQTLRRFMIATNVLVTVVAAAIAFTPLFDVVVAGLIGVPPAVADAARPGMKILTFWSAAIGWRRFYQGVLIRHGETRFVGYGTLLRLVSSAGTAIGLALATPRTGVEIAAISLMAGVTTEALFVARVVRPTLARLRARHERDGSGEVSMRDAIRYHAPLAATSFLNLLAQPLIGAGLARMPHPEENLAAWPVVWGLLFVFRSPGFALPEAVIALLAGRTLEAPVRRFCRRVGLVSAAALGVVVATPLLDLYLRHAAGLPPALARRVEPALVVSIVLPYINAVHSWLRGVLMGARATGVVYRGMGLNLSLTIAIVALGVLLQAPGTIVAVVALAVAFAVEVQYLRARARPVSTSRAAML
jgi:hypothetical protein